MNGINIDRCPEECKIIIKAIRRGRLAVIVYIIK